MPKIKTCLSQVKMRQKAAKYDIGYFLSIRRPLREEGSFYHHQGKKIVEKFLLVEKFFKKESGG